MSKKKNKASKTSKIRGEERKRHFEDGGSLAEWRGLHHIHNSKKRRSRRKERIKAIEDSKDE